MARPHCVFVLITLGAASGVCASDGDAGKVATAVSASDGDTGKKNLGNLSIEDLMKVEVTTASKEAQSYQRVPAAIYVITQEMIRRAGARNIPEALRMAPGVQVAQAGPSQWQISIRGFNSPFADKLLVLIDGRSVYNTTFSGVDWDTLEIQMEDIDRIEVIRGPGGSLWGTNAVNGIINVISKKASETLGTYVSLQSSTMTPYEASARYGGRLGSDTTFRVFAKAFNSNALNSTVGVPGGDDWQDLRIGFRGDWTGSTDSVTLSGGANSEHLGGISAVPTFTSPYSQLTEFRYPASDANVVGRWQRTSGPFKGTELQADYTHTVRESANFGEEHERAGADFQMPVTLSPKNRFTWGLGVSSTRDVFTSGSFVTVPGNSLVENVISGFLHDDWKVLPNLTAAAGVKAEHNRYTGWEIQPSATLTWTPSQKQTVWGAISRAVRTPSVVDESIVDGLTVVPTQHGPAEIAYVGSPLFQSEVLLANEIGWRFAPSSKLVIDATVFYNQYTRLRSVTPGMPYVTAGSNPALVLPYVFANDLGASTAGFELDTRYQVKQDWQLEGTYTLYSERFYFADGIPDTTGTTGPERSGITPRNQVGIRSLLNLPKRFELDTSVTYVEGTPFGVAANTRVDLRVGWQPNQNTEVSVGGQNLLTANHQEGLNAYGFADYIPRNFYMKVSFKF